MRNGKYRKKKHSALVPSYSGKWLSGTGIVYFKNEWKQVR